MMIQFRRCVSASFVTIFRVSFRDVQNDGCGKMRESGCNAVGKEAGRDTGRRDSLGSGNR